MKQRDWFLRVMVTLLAVGVWGLLLRPLLAPRTGAADEQQVTQREVQAQRFVLVDEKGKQRAVLGVTDEGQDTFLQMYDARGARALRLGDASYRNKAKLVHRALLLMDKDGKHPVAGLEYLSDEDRAALTLRGRDGASADLAIGTGPNAAAQFGLQGKDGGSAVLAVARDGSPSLRLSDKSGRLLFRAPEGAPAPVSKPPGGGYLGVAREYFAFLREGKVPDARRLATFETDPIVKQTWEKQAGDYAKRLAAGGRKWWGDAIAGQRISGPPPGEWAAIEVQWRYLAGMGWMMGPHYTYLMRTVNGEWKMVISKDMIQRGIPFVPADTAANQ